MRVYVTGTDTDAGKTRVCASLALARRNAGVRPTIVKLAQTGLMPGEAGDAATAAALAGCAGAELARFKLPADPWNAALAEGVRPLEARELAVRVREIAGDVIVEGSGGAAVPLNARESISDVAVHAELEALIVVGLRLGCISHALLTAEYLRRRNVPVLGAVLVARFGPLDPAYEAQVRTALAPSLRLVATLPHEPDASAAVRQGAFHWGG